MNVEQLLEQDMTKEAGRHSEVIGTHTSVGITTLLGALLGGGLGSAVSDEKDSGVLGALLGAGLGLGVGGVANSAAATAGMLGPHDRSKEEQEESDKDILKNLLIPGYAAHNVGYRSGTLLDNAKNTIKDN